MSSGTFATKGQRLAYDVYGGTTLVDVRAEGEITIGNAEEQGVIPQTVFADGHRQEKPVKFGEAQTEAVVVSTLIRMAASAGGEPFSIEAFRAGGYDIATPEPDDTIATYASVTSYTTTTGTTTAAGKFRTIELSNGEFFPVLMVADGAAGAITPLYALPSATEAGKAIKKTWTISPGQQGPIASGSMLGFRYTNRAYTPDSVIIAAPAWLASVGDLVFEPGTLPTLTFTFGASDVSEVAAPVLSLATANNFADAEPVKVSDKAYLIIADADGTGSIALSTQCFMKATIVFGVKAEPIPGLGCATAINGVQGAVTIYEPASLELEILWDQDKADEWNGTNVSKCVGIIQPSTSADVPAWAFVMPNAHLMERPDQDKSGSTIKMTLKYTPNPAGLASTTAIGSSLNSIWYFGISDRSA
jgi:hypothetical protein